MPSIPQSEFLSTRNLSQVFNNTTATYKFYWFMSILQMYNIERKDRMNAKDIAIRMIANAWYPIHYFRLSFGAGDSLNEIVNSMEWVADLKMDSTSQEIINKLTLMSNHPEVRTALNKLTTYVPYRFLMPWIHTASDKEMIERSHSLENHCLYSIHKESKELYIVINPVWYNYLAEYYGILTDFINWNLTLFLQARNPNVPNIPNKLTRPAERFSLARQHRFWNDIIKTGATVHCIYSGREIHIGNYAIDHFLPWSFVAHDQLWNLIPADQCINSSKGDKLPPIEKYLPKLAEEHRNAIRAYLSTGKETTAIDDFTALGYTPRELFSLNKERFLAAYQQTFTPLFQIARNMGYGVWMV